MLKLLVFLNSEYTVYDIDDAEYVRRPDKTIQYFIKKTSLTVAGSQSLIDYVKSLNQKGEFVTSPVIHHNYLKKARNKMYTIGWIGYYSAHKESLKTLLFPALTRIQFPIKLILLGVRSQNELQEIISLLNTNSITVEADMNIDWHNEPDIYKRIANFDIGVSPLINNEFNQAKSAFKIKQYLSCGVPAIGSNVGENSTFIEHGINGFLAENCDDFLKYVNLMHDLETNYYEQMKLNAKSSQFKFDMHLYANQYLNVFT